MTGAFERKAPPTRAGTHRIMAPLLAILGLACAAYGVSVMMVHSGTAFFAVWYALGAALLIAAWLLHSGIWDGWPAFARHAVTALACAALALCAVTQACALSCFSADVEHDELNCIIVLGAQVRADGTPSVVLQNRLDTAFDYLVAHPAARCIVSGGQGPNEPEAEARAMARYLESRGVDTARITIEDESANTVGNIRNSMRLIDPLEDRVGIVTNNFHVFRGTAIARKQGIVHVSGIAAPSNPWYLPNNLLRETFGISKDFVQGNL